MGALAPSALALDDVATLPADARAARLAELGAVVGVAGIVTLGLMYAVEVPRGGPYRFGAANDLCGAAFSALFIPVASRVARHLPDTPGLQFLTRASLIAAGAGAILPILLVAGVMPFEVETPLVIACIELESIWLVVAGQRLGSVPTFPKTLARLSRLVGASFIAGTAIVAVGFAIPETSPLRIVAWGVGGVVGAAGWLGWPYWYHALAHEWRRGTRRGA